MKGVTFGSKHTYKDWGLILREHPVVSPPKPKTKLVDVLGAHGSLDMTTKLTGQVLYEMREITCELTVIGNREEWEQVYSEILNYLQGQLMDITLDHDPDYIWTGRAEISKWNPGQTVAEMTIKAKVSPYKTSHIDGRKVL